MRDGGGRRGRGAQEAGSARPPAVPSCSNKAASASAAHDDAAVAPSRLHDVRVGTSGWAYAHWRGGAYYPKGLPQSRELHFLSRQLNSVELNGSFYSLQRVTSYQEWARVTPPGFMFAIKGSKYITHIKKCRDVVQPLANFLASGVLALGSKLGPILWQLPATLSYESHGADIESFLELLPKDTRAAAAFAAAHYEPQKMARTGALLGNGGADAADRNQAQHGHLHDRGNGSDRSHAVTPAVAVAPAAASAAGEVAAMPCATQSAGIGGGGSPGDGSTCGGAAEPAGHPAAAAAVRPLRHALEVRHASFSCDTFYQALLRHNVALVVADTAGTFPQLEAPHTADWLYVRLHGHSQLYSGLYGEERLAAWAERLRSLAARCRGAASVGPGAGSGGGGVDCFVYFDNDGGAAAPRDATSLSTLLMAPHLPLQPSAHLLLPPAAPGASPPAAAPAGGTLAGSGDSMPAAALIGAAAVSTASAVASGAQLSLLTGAGSSGGAVNDMPQNGRGGARGSITSDAGQHAGEVTAVAVAAASATDCTRTTAVLQGGSGGHDSGVVVKVGAEADAAPCSWVVGRYQPRFTWPWPEEEVISCYGRSSRCRGSGGGAAAGAAAASTKSSGRKRAKSTGKPPQEEVQAVHEAKRQEDGGNVARQRKRQRH